jgi:hypothetical protein
MYQGLLERSMIAVKAHSPDGEPNIYLDFLQPDVYIRTLYRVAWTTPYICIHTLQFLDAKTELNSGSGSSP